VLPDTGMRPNAGADWTVWSGPPSHLGVGYAQVRCAPLRRSISSSTAATAVMSSSDIGGRAAHTAAQYSADVVPAVVRAGGGSAVRGTGIWCVAVGSSVVPPCSVVCRSVLLSSVRCPHLLSGFGVCCRAWPGRSPYPVNTPVSALSASVISSTVPDASAAPKVVPDSRTPATPPSTAVVA
jgi:hypothetical protein